MRDYDGRFTSGKQKLPGQVEGLNAWRKVFALLSILSTSIVAFLIVCPYRVNSDLQERLNSNLETNRMQASEVRRLHLRVDLLDEGQDVEKIINELGTCGERSYLHEEYEDAAWFFGESFRVQQDIRASRTQYYPDEQKARNWPIYEISLLRSQLKELEDCASNKAAYDTFLSHLASMTNSVGVAFNNHNEHTFIHHSDKLEVAVAHLHTIRNGAPTAVTNAIDLAIMTLESLLHNTNHNHAP